MGAGKDEAKGKGEVDKPWYATEPCHAARLFLLPKAPDQTQDQGACGQVLKAASEAFGLGTAHGERGEPTTGFMFTNSNGTPIELSNLQQRVIVPALETANLNGGFAWHRFRRGLASGLHAAGIDDITIQGILRHDSIETTRASYIKTLPQQLRDAMTKGIQQQIDAVDAAPQRAATPARI